MSPAPHTSAARPPPRRSELRPPLPQVRRLRLRCVGPRFVMHLLHPKSASKQKWLHWRLGSAAALEFHGIHPGSSNLELTYCVPYRWHGPQPRAMCLRLAAARASNASSHNSSQHFSLSTPMTARLPRCVGQLPSILRQAGGAHSWGVGGRRVPRDEHALQPAPHAASERPSERLNEPQPQPQPRRWHAHEQPSPEPGRDHESLRPIWSSRHRATRQRSWVHSDGSAHGRGRISFHGDGSVEGHARLHAHPMPSSTTISASGYPPTIRMIENEMRILTPRAAKFRLLDLRCDLADVESAAQRARWRGTTKAA